MHKTIYFLFTVFFLTSCQPSETETINVEDKYSITIPAFLSKSSILNSDASLQYQHIFKEFYVIVIDETKEEFLQAINENELTEPYSSDLNGYTKLLMDSFENSINTYQKAEFNDTIINGVNAKLTSITGKSEGVDAYFMLAFLEGDKRFYQIMTWTLSNRKYTYNDMMKKLIYSFKELQSVNSY